MLIFWLCGFLLVGPGNADSTGSFSLLTMNVAGLPSIFNDNDVPGDKETNSKHIGTFFGAYNYDVIHVQEDFNYHAYIYEKDTHPYRTATSGGAGFGSGLNSLSNFDWIAYDRVEWDHCSNDSGADCLTPKGFTSMRVRIAEGVYIDMYNVHTDAGTETGDEVARRANLDQLARYIHDNSAGNAVIVFGDTNSRYSRTADGIKSFRDESGLKDAWVDLIRNKVDPSEETDCSNPSLNNRCETVDKVFYRGSSILQLQPMDWRYESRKFLQPDGNVLSDHNPVACDFRWTLTNRLRQSDFWGGPHGSWFSDLPQLSSIDKPKVSVINLRAGSRLDSVGVTLAGTDAFTHGGNGGAETTLTLAKDEYWTQASLCQGQRHGHTRIFSLRAITSWGRMLAVGTTTSDCKDFVAPTGWHIIGFMGQSGDEIDRLGFIFSPP
ncbi:hypothetical protein E4U43_004194 [Claviceps pusilla]|uniref:Jacalin-type lectin domain-containing protein n=1 Tax=Claviceps pusilla TaxID=123648 RepID=A0A9P7SX71_9HYPO|nr:hypothetical protein E4U43_004194 [Claviceps pusilla]